MLFRSVCWKVENPSDEMIHFSIGGHPAFYCPVDVDRKQTDYFLKIGSGEQVKCTKLSENGLALQEQKVLPLQKGILAITDTLFDGDALVIEQDQAHQVSLLRPNKKAYLTVTFDAPLFGIWSPPHKKAPFICIEPWYGRCDAENFCGTIEDREWNMSLASKKTWNSTYKVELV